MVLVVVGSCNRLTRQTPLDPLSEGEAYRTLERIDSLMWRQPDSALKVMMEFAAKVETDSMDAFEGHYCQLLISELLYKNYKQQSNRDDLLRAVGYFDSIVVADGYNADGRKADARGASLRERNVFLDARAHYINGAGFYERNDVVNACAEYLKALEAMEEQFEEVIDAAKKAYIYDQIMELPNGFNSKAQQLSGGQQQRIAIARMFLKNPPIIFLDEPTASLDAIATEQIKASIDAIKQNRTVIIISHNISQIIDSDIIYALRNGRVEESGDPDDVYRQGGVYKEIVDASARSLNIGKLARTLDTDGDGKIDL